MPGDRAQSERVLWLEDLAYNGETMPEGLRFPEQLLFLRLRYLYAYARQISMDPEQGRREKHEIIKAYELHAAGDALISSTSDRYSCAEAAAAAIRKDAALYDNPKVRALLVALYGDVDRKERSP